MFIPTTIYLAESTVQIISVYACLVERGDEGAVIFVDRSHTHGDDGVESLLAAGRIRFPQARIVDYRPLPQSSIQPQNARIVNFFRDWNATRRTKQAIVEALCSQLKLSESSIKNSVKAVNFTFTHYYVLCFLAIFPHSVFIVYPHSLSEPRPQGVEKWPYLYKKRSLRTLLQTLPHQFRDFGVGAMLRGFLGRLVGQFNILLPFPGVNQVVTFRLDAKAPGNNLSRVVTLETTLRWLLSLPPWMQALAEIPSNSNDRVIVVLPECNRHPLWVCNPNFGQSHVILIKELLRKFPNASVVLKPHVRSDGAAAQWLYQYLLAALPTVEVSILSPPLSRIPIEAIVLFGNYSAACSIGSVSLPAGLGFGLSHYFCAEAASLFDEGWREPFWVNYEKLCKLLVSDGIGVFVDGR